MIYASVAAVAFLFNLLFIPGILTLSHKNKWYDPKDPRKIHTGDIPRTGGVGIFLAFWASMALLLLSGRLLPAFPSLSAVSVLPLAAGTAVLFVTGLLDDFKNLRARYKLFLQILAAILVTGAGYGFTSFSLPFGLSLSWPVLTYGVTLLWIVGVTNAVNLIDGMDGLAGGVAGIAALFWGLISLLWGHTFSASLSFALLGAVTGFLVYNRPPAKIFMGDSGSLVLGFLLAILPLLEKDKGAGTRVLLTAGTILVIPVFDTLSSILRRIRNGQSIGSPDRAHMHHKLMNLGLNTPRILLVVYGFCVFSGAAALLFSALPGGINLYFLPLAWLPVLGFFLFLHYRHRAANPSEAQR